MGLADFAENLSFLLTIVPREIVKWSSTSRAGAVFGDITLNTTKNRLNGFMITLFVVVDEILPVPILLERNDVWELVNLKLLIFGRMGIIKSPLLKRDISTDKM